jgi:glycosyltransferase involved in cell wall biosynthesis
MVLGWQEVTLVQALLACRSRRVPVLLRGESNVLRSRGRAVSLIHRLYLGLCDGFLAIGQADAAFSEAAGVRPDRIVTASYFVDNARFASDADRLRHERVSIRESFGLADGSTCFAFVGKLEPKKRPLDVIQGLRQARDRGADVCGLFVGSGELMEDARTAAQEYGVPVAFAGFLNQSEIARAYVAADALVLPSDFGETWGLVVNEVMATGLPAIVSDRIGAANDLVIHGDTGLVVPFGRTDAIADAMVRLTTQPAARVDMGRRARERVYRDYSIARAVEATRTLIGRIGANAEGQRVEA